MTTGRLPRARDTDGDGDIDDDDLRALGYNEEQIRAQREVREATAEHEDTIARGEAPPDPAYSGRGGLTGSGVYASGEERPPNMQTPEDELRSDQFYYDRQRDLTDQVYGGLSNIDYGPEGFVEGPAESALAGAAADPRSIDAQMRALAEMEGVYRQGGLTTLDRARIAEAQAGERTYERGQRDALRQEAEQRGMGAGGAGYAGALMAQQRGANRLNQQGLGIEAMAEQRALEAMGMAGNLGGQARGQSFDEDATRRQAQDLLARYNTDYARGHSERAAGRGDRRVDRRDRLGGSYLDRRQDLLDTQMERNQEARAERRSRSQAEQEERDKMFERGVDTVARIAG